MDIYIDVLGGDHAPKETVKGAVEAIKEYDQPLILVGKKEEIAQELKELDFDDPRISIIDARSSIEFDEEPVKALRHKKDSSLVVALNHMKGNEDAVLVSAGSSGALLAGGVLILGRIPGVKRPGFGMTFPQEKKQAFMIDVGASADSQPEYLVTYAKLAKIYLENVMEEEKPLIGLLSNGSEAEKGNKFTKAAHELLKESGLDFYGNVEPSNLFTTEANILVCDGFTGNIIIKTIEGTSTFMFKGIKKELLKTLKGKIGALLVKKDLKKFRDNYDPNEIGGLPLLGVNGGIIKAHGSSDSYAFKNAIYQAIMFSKNQVVAKIKNAL